MEKHQGLNQESSEGVRFTLSDFVDPLRVRQLLNHRAPMWLASMTGERYVAAATSLLELHDRCSPAVAVYAPGRIEVLGKHTDYAGGSSLTCAVCRAFCAVAVPTSEHGVRVQDVTSGDSVFIPYDLGSRPSVTWATYPATVVHRIVRNFGKPGTGVHIAFSSDVPRASGMSSSSAFVIAVWMCVSALVDVAATVPFRENLRTGSDLATYIGRIENGQSFGHLKGDSGVGTRGGTQDHTAILFSSSGKIGHYGYLPLRRIDEIELPEDMLFVLASSGVKAQKTQGARRAYNNAVSLAEDALSAWSSRVDTSFWTLAEMIESPSFSMDEFSSALDMHIADSDHREAVRLRTLQFMEETRSVIPGAIDALKNGDWEGLGRLVARSQQMADQMLRNQVPETRMLVESAIRNGARAASSFGAGFGGSVWALVQQAEAKEFLRTWLIDYGRVFTGRMRQACFFSDGTGPGAFILGADPVSMLIEPKF